MILSQKRQKTQQAASSCDSLQTGQHPTRKLSFNSSRGWGYKGQQSACPGVPGPKLDHRPHVRKANVLACACNSRTREVEAGHSPGTPW